MGRYSGQKCRLLTMFALTSGYFLVELVVGYMTNSMALIADSFNMLSDVASFVIAFISARLSTKKASRNTYGWARAEILGALVNSVFLFALCFSIFIEALERFYSIEDINDPKMILIVGAGGLLVNVIGLLLFRDQGNVEQRRDSAIPVTVFRKRSSRLAQLAAFDINKNDLNYTQPVLIVDDFQDKSAAKTNGSLAIDGKSLPAGDSVKEDPVNNRENKSKSRNGATDGSSGSEMNMRGVFLHILADALGSVIVIISALIIWLTNWEYKNYVDPILSLVMVVLILQSTWPLLKQSSMVLLQFVPPHIQVDSIKTRLLEQIEDVVAVHELHVWQLAGDKIIASAHVSCRKVSDYMKTSQKVKDFFHNEGIHSTTIQLEITEVGLLGISPQLPDTNEAHKSEECAISCPDSHNYFSKCVSSACCDVPKEKRSQPGRNDKISKSVTGCNNGALDAQSVNSVKTSAASPVESSNENDCVVHL